MLAQIVYFFSASLELVAPPRAHTEQVAPLLSAVDFVVPTGNFGDVLAGWYAMQMGAPIRRLVLATNENDILARFFATGVYSVGRLHQTLAPSMDIQVASNFERYLFYKLGRDGAALCGKMAELDRTGSLSVPLDEKGAVDERFIAGAANREQVLETIGAPPRLRLPARPPHGRGRVGGHEGVGRKFARVQRARTG